MAIILLDLVEQGKFVFVCINLSFCYSVLCSQSKYSLVCADFFDTTNGKMVSKSMNFCTWYKIRPPENYSSRKCQ